MVTGKKEQPTKQGDAICYINVSVSFIMEVDSSIPVSTAKETLVDEKEVEPAMTEEWKKNSEKRRQEIADAEMKKVTEKSEPETPEQKYIEDLVMFGAVNGQDPKFIPDEKARTVCSIPAEVSDAKLFEIKKVASKKWKEQKSE
jgi:hypothetical protein